jgi:hypothetical protein
VSKLSRPISEYQSALAKLQDSFSTAFAMFEEVKAAIDAADTVPADQSILLQGYYKSFSSMQQKLQPTVSPSSNVNIKAVDSSTSPDLTMTSTQTAMAMPSFGGPTFNASSNLSMLSTSVEFSRTLEAYSNMLVEMVKDKLNQSTVLK